MALNACRGDFIVFLDGDEAFSPEAIAYLAKDAQQPGSDIFNIPCRHHIIGRHDERAYYWPQRHIRAFRRGALQFKATVHGGIDVCSKAVADLAYSSNICFHNVSHLNTEDWIEKTNRYTSMKDRNSTFEGADESSLVDVARQAVERWGQKTHGSSDRYVQAVAMLRAVYDIVDAVKHWEQSEGLNLRAMIAETCAGLEMSYDILERTTGLDTGGSGRLRGRGGGLR
jgi:glycosyltransferase involved in cell wall biosynthesis